MTPVKISHSSSTMYNECGRKYDLHYNQRIRPIKQRSALVFGSAIDTALNALLEGKSEEEAKAVFLDKMTHIEVNNTKVDLSLNPDGVLYSKADHDVLLGGTPRESLIAKGNLMLRDYNKKIMPRIRKIIVVQEKSEVLNAEGDRIAGALDIILEWEDGKVYLMDNKTTSVPYAPDSAGKAPQLSLYYWAEKEKYGLQGVGFFTLNKKIDHNEKKICKTCGFDGSGGRHKTCSNKPEKKRCDGEWDITYNPECEINVIINDVNEETLDQTFVALDNTNHGISNGIFEPNRTACIGKFGKCQYFDLCHKGSMDNLIEVPKNDNR